MKTFELRSGEIVFSVESYTPMGVRQLPDELLLALVGAGLKEWGYRGGARKKNDGKTFTIAEIARMIAEGGSRDGEPTKVDEEVAKRVLDGIKAMVPKDEEIEDMSAYIWERIESKVGLNAEKHGYEAIGREEEETPLTYLARWHRQNRLAIARKIKADSAI